jgi:hypothetical protein
LISFLLFLFFFLRVTWHNTRPIKWNKSSEASKEREKRERNRKKIFTLLMHTFIEYIYCVVCECLACAHTQRKNNILYILILVWHTYIYIYIWYWQWLLIIYTGSETVCETTPLAKGQKKAWKKERLEIIIIIIIKLLQLCVGVWERKENESKEREQTIEHDK